jgi:hypothetical protein
VGFVVDKVALVQVLSEYFGFPCQFSFQRLLHTYHLSSGPGTIGQLVADVPTGLSLTPPRESKKKETSSVFRGRAFKAWTIFARSNTGIVGSNPNLWDICAGFFCVVLFCVPCDGLIPRPKSPTDCVED